MKKQNVSIFFFLFLFAVVFNCLFINWNTIFADCKNSKRSGGGKPILFIHGLDGSYKSISFFYLNWYWMIFKKYSLFITSLIGVILAFVIIIIYLFCYYCCFVITILPSFHPFFLSSLLFSSLLSLVNLVLNITNCSSFISQCIYRLYKI